MTSGCFKPGGLWRACVYRPAAAEKPPGGPPKKKNNLRGGGGGELDLGSRPRWWAADGETGWVGVNYGPAESDWLRLSIEAGVCSSPWLGPIEVDQAEVPYVRPTVASRIDCC